MLRYFLWTVSIVIVLSGCQRSGNGAGSDAFTPDPAGNTLPAEAYEVIYALHLPTDIVRLFEETGTIFNPDLLLPLDKIPFYENPGQIALLMGSLGVDLSYCKLFEQVHESAESYKHMELLADKLELPQEIFEKSSDELEYYIEKPDSLTALINQVYTDVDSYFKANHQESLASLTLLGGWLETMYIGVRIYQDWSILEMGDRILQQKYALNSLAGLLANYQESLMVRRFMHPLNKLKQAYEKVDIRYAREGFQMEPEARTFYGSVSEMIYEPEVLDNICEIITQIRSEIIQ